MGKILAETVSCFHTLLEAVDTHLKATMMTSIYPFTHSLNGTGSLKGCTSIRVKKKKNHQHSHAELYE